MVRINLDTVPHSAVSLSQSIILHIVAYIAIWQFSHSPPLEANGHASVLILLFAVVIC